MGTYPFAKLVLGWFTEIGDMNIEKVRHIFRYYDWSFCKCSRNIGQI